MKREVMNYDRASNLGLNVFDECVCVSQLLNQLR